MTELQINIIGLWVAGLKNSEIAERLECSVHTVTAVKKNKEFRQLYYEALHEQIANLVPLAVRRLKDLLGDDCTQASVTIAAVKEVLDRAGVNKLCDNVSDKEIKISIEYIEKAADDGSGEV